jgi:hypothetical protein
MNAAVCQNGNRHGKTRQREWVQATLYRCGCEVARQDGRTSWSAQRARYLKHSVSVPANVSVRGCQRLAVISVSHLCNLRLSPTYQRQCRTLTKTRPKSATIGQSRKPQPSNQSSYIRIDSVHQGDQDKRKCMYHINVVD